MMGIGGGLWWVIGSKDGAKGDSEHGESDGYTIRPWSVVQSNKKHTYDQQDEQLGHLPSVPSGTRE